MLKASIITFLVSMVPIIELRGALPIGVGMGLSPLVSAAISVIGNLLPVPFLLWLVPKIFDWLRDKKYTKKIIAWFEKKAEKNHKTIDKYGWLGLYILVAIPLPGTGAWTGALVSSCFKMKFWPSILAIVAGVITAGAIILGITYGVTAII